MTTLTFDTHAAIKVMKDSGLEEAHAESIVAAIQMGEAHRENLVTEAVLHATLQAALKDSEQRMTIRLGLMIFAAATLAVAGARLF